MWADRRWARAGDYWLEVRSSAPDVLETLGYRDLEPPDGADSQEGVFSILVDDPAKKTRSLPTLYHGRAQVFSDRRLEEVGRRLNRALEVIAVAESTSSFMATACRFEGKHGLYTRDLFNRASFRLRMTRLGMEFADDPYVRMSADAFSCLDWGEFRPEFVIGGGPYPRDEDALEKRKGGLTPFMFGILRVGQVTGSDLATIAKLVTDVPVLVSQSPKAVLEAVAAG